MPPLELSNDLEVTLPSASTLKEVMVIVPMVKSPEPSMLIALDNEPAFNEAVPSVSVAPVTVPVAVTEDAFTVVNVPAAAVAPPITDPSIVELSISPPSIVKLLST